MEKIYEKDESIKLCNYIIENMCRLMKKQKIQNVKIVLKNGLIHIDIDDYIYTISNMVIYKKFIDQLSFKYTLFIRYFPRSNDKELMNKIIINYFKNFKVNIIINNEGINIS